MKILIVVGESGLKKTLLEWLRSEELVADAVREGEEAFYKVMYWNYDLIVLDENLSDMNGWEFLKKLRDAERMIPVVFLSDEDDWQEKEGEDHCGADGYLKKPVEKNELLAHVYVALKNAGSKVQPVVTVGSLHLNTAMRSVSLNGNDIALTAREYELLKILMDSYNEVVSRDKIYEHIFESTSEHDSADTVSNMLDVYIYKLRQKVGKERLLTRRGFGYMLVP